MKIPIAPVAVGPKRARPVPLPLAERGGPECALADMVQAVVHGWLVTDKSPRRILKDSSARAGLVRVPRGHVRYTLCQDGLRR